MATNPAVLAIRSPGDGVRRDYSRPTQLQGREALAAELARDLHDGVAQTLATVLIELENFRAEQERRRGVLSEIELVQGQIREALFNIRQVLYDLRGMPAVDRDFPGTLRNGLLLRFEARTGILMHLSVSKRWPGELPAHVALNLYRIIQEGLTNVERHSGAHRVWISLALSGRESVAVVRIRDDGRGFTAHASERRDGLGMLGIRERALLAGGHVSFKNRPKGRGGMVVVRLARAGLG